MIRLLINTPKTLLIVSEVVLAQSQVNFFTPAFQPGERLFTLIVKSSLLIQLAASSQISLSQFASTHAHVCAA
jgi:hypothetical protein